MSSSDVSERIGPPASTPAQREVLVYSYYRDAELRGSNLIYRLLRILQDDESQMLLSEHLADETRHAWLWTERIREVGGAPQVISDGYQVRIGRRSGIPRDPVDLLALTAVVEQRALRRYQQHLRRPGVSDRTMEVLRAVTKDEGWHVDWVRRKGRELAARAGEPERFGRALERFRAIDLEVWTELEAVEQELFDAAPSPAEDGGEQAGS